MLFRSVLGAGQIIRIFILPAMMYAKLADDKAKAAAGIPVMPTDQYTRVVAYLALSALCLLTGAVINLLKSRKLAAYEASLKQTQA